MMPEATPPDHGHPVAPETGADPQSDLLERLRQVTLGEYDILALLGTGGMANVYLAHDLALDRRVAIKVMSPAMVYGAGLVERFRQEARTSAALSHPNIIPIYAVREVGGLLFFVMKVVDGTSLDAVMEEAGALPFAMVEAILAQVGGALGYAHRHGVVHRDIKPANILLDQEGWVVVTDFGIAKVAETSGLTLTGTAMGTPTYMSPEQCAGGEISGASDQYSLGVVAYEMITGTPPFADRSVPALMIGHTTREPPPVSAARPDCPDALAAAVMRMLAKEPTDRFDSVEASITAAEARPLAPDDPTRNTMVALARSGSTRQMIAQVRTPRSPVPLIARSRPGAAGASTPIPPPLSRHRSALQLGGGLTLGVLATVAVVFILGRGRGDPTDSTDPVGSVPQVGAPLEGDAPTPDGPDASGATTPPSTTPVPPPPAAAAAVNDAPRPAANPGDSPPAGATGLPEPGAGKAATVVEPAPESSEPVVAATQPPIAVPPPPSPAAAIPTPVTTPVPDPRVEVEAVIRSYARALESGRIEAAVRIFPAMPAAQRQGLAAFYQGGGTMRTAWQITNIVVAGTTATLRISGTTRVMSEEGQSSAEPVALRARLEHGPAGWRLTALDN